MLLPILKRKSTITRQQNNKKCNFASFYKAFQVDEIRHKSFGSAFSKADGMKVFCLPFFKIFSLILRLLTCRALFKIFHHTKDDLKVFCLLFFKKVSYSLLNRIVTPFLGFTFINSSRSGLIPRVSKLTILFSAV